MPQTTSADLLALTPDRYLAGGYVDGGPRPELRQLWATAACAQLMAAELSPQEFAFTLDAIGLLLPEHDEASPATRLHATVQEALEVVARAIQQRNNEGLVRWLSACVARVVSEADLQAFLGHAEAVRRQYVLLVSLTPS